MCETGADPEVGNEPRAGRVAASLPRSTIPRAHNRARIRSGLVGAVRERCGKTCRTALRPDRYQAAPELGAAALRIFAVGEVRAGYLVGLIRCGNFHRGRLPARSVLPIFNPGQCPPWPMP